MLSAHKSALLAWLVWILSEDPNWEIYIRTLAQLDPLPEDES